MEQDQSLVQVFFTLLQSDMKENHLETLSQVISLFLTYHEDLIKEIKSAIQETSVSTNNAKVLYSRAKDFVEEFSIFLNYLIKIEIENILTFEQLLKKFGLVTILSKGKEEYYEVIKSHINKYKHAKLSNYLVNHDWQLSLIEKEKDAQKGVNYDKVELALKLRICEDESFKDKLIKLNYYEFSEIYSNLKKIDKQLHVFKS